MGQTQLKSAEEKAQFTGLHTMNTMNQQTTTLQMGQTQLKSAEELTQNEFTGLIAVHGCRASTDNATLQIRSAQLKPAVELMSFLPIAIPYQSIATQYIKVI